MIITSGLVMSDMCTPEMISRLIAIFVWPHDSIPPPNKHFPGTTVFGRDMCVDMIYLARAQVDKSCNLNIRNLIYADNSIVRQGVPIKDGLFWKAMDKMVGPIQTDDVSTNGTVGIQCVTIKKINTIGSLNPYFEQ